jgi:hypothetical protein
VEWLCSKVCRRRVAVIFIVGRTREPWARQVVVGTGGQIGESRGRCLLVRPGLWRGLCAWGGLVAHRVCVVAEHASG